MVKLGEYHVTGGQITYGLVALAGLYILQGVVKFLALFVRHRRKYADKDLPQPPHHWLLGHIPIMAKIGMEFPFDSHPQSHMPVVMERYGLTDKGICYLDLWPLGSPMCIISDTNLAHQVVQAHSLPKWRKELDRVILPLTGPGNLVTAEGAAWRFWRTVFNPGFSSQHLMTLVPGIVDDCEVFCNAMTKAANSGETVKLEILTTCLTVDVIGRVVLDVELNTQIKPHPLVEAFKSQVQWLSKHMEMNPFTRFNPFKPLVHWWNQRTMRKIVGDMLDQRFLVRDPMLKTGKRGKPIIDLALETYFKEKGNTVTKMDSEFRELAIDQIMIFIFAGHDTTSSTICYIFHLLSQYPEKMERARKELDDLFGSDPKDAARLIKENPALLNKMEYCTAIIKEVLRLYPPVSTIRAGEPGFFMKDPKTGQLYPTDETMIWPLAYVFHHREAYFSDPHTFRPERWLEDPNTGSNGTWRPFEKGPRNCIGQELAILETKTIVATSLRRFDVQAQRPHNKKGIWEVNGDFVYQQLIGTAKPRDGMPAKISIASRPA